MSARAPEHRQSHPAYRTEATAPTRIVLYAANLAAYVDPDDEQELAREVEITLLHEIGHYFGLGEAEVEALGLG